jgi:type II secretory pathway component PulL
MADWILVRLGRDTAQPHQWVCVAVSGHLSEAPGSGDDQALLAAAEGRRVALVVPGSDVLQTLVVVPAGSESRQAQIIPYALEDQVAEDLESLHETLFWLSQPGIRDDLATAEQDETEGTTRTSAEVRADLGLPER